MANLIARAYQTSQQWLALGHECMDIACARLVRNRATPRIYDAKTNEIVASKRRKSADVRYLLAQVDGVDCGFFSAWPGTNGVGLI